MLAESFITLMSLASMQVVNQTPSAQVWNALPTAKYAEVVAVGPVKRASDSLGVDATAKSSLVIDVKSGAVLFEHGADEARSIASLTKLMTAMTFLDQKPNLDEEVVMTGVDTPEGERTIFAPNERVTKRELLRAMIVASLNEAGNALARTSTGGTDDFLRQMNTKAKDMKLKKAQFFDPTGLNPQNQATARDVATMLRTSMNYPDIRDAANLNRVQWKSRVITKTYVLKSTNLLLDSFLNQKPYQVVAAKTGTLNEAGYCFAQATKNQEGNEVIAVVLASDSQFSRFQDAKSLTYWAFQNFDWSRTAKRSQEIARIQP